MDRSRTSIHVPEPDTPTFAAVPRLVEDCLTGDGDPLLGQVGGHFDCVVLILLDALGRMSLDRHADHPLVRRIHEHGELLPLRAQFPSTTAAHVTTLHTGLPVGQHGIYEWHVYEPSLNRVICPLPFSFGGDTERETLVGKLSPDALLPFETVYQRLAAKGLSSGVLADAGIVPSTYTDQVLAGAKDVVVIHKMPQAMVAVRNLIAAGCSYVVLYDGSMDYLGHLFGPESDEFHAQVEARLTLIEHQLVNQVPGDGSTLLLLTADHGHMPMDPGRLVYLNEVWPDVALLVRVGADGRPLPPSGSQRALFLHTRPGRTDAVTEGVRAVLGDRADVYQTHDLIEQGVFGAEVGERLTARLGEVAVLPRWGSAVWWREPDRFGEGISHRGLHGGLSNDEMLTFLAALPL
jgi:hypothetical protein